METDNQGTNNKQSVLKAPSEPTPPSEETIRAINSRKYILMGISLFALIILAAFFIAFIYGWYGLYAVGLISLGAIPLVLIGGTVFCVYKRKWFTLGFGFILLPPSWVVTLLGCMSDPPWDPTDISAHLIYATVLVSGAFVCWLYLNLIFWPRRS